jgi:hypothetical protein
MIATTCPQTTPPYAAPSRPEAVSVAGAGEALHLERDLLEEGVSVILEILRGAVFR